MPAALLILSLICLQASYNSINDSQRVTAAAGLGLAVLAGLCRVPQLSAATEVIEKTPLFLKVYSIACCIRTQIYALLIVKRVRGLCHLSGCLSADLFVLQNRLDLCA